MKHQNSFLIQSTRDQTIASSGLDNTNSFRSLLQKVSNLQASKKGQLNREELKFVYESYLKMLYFSEDK